MHEFSLVRALLVQVEEILAGQGGGVVHEIHLECGPLSGVEPSLLISAFEQLRPPGPLGYSSLVIEPVRLKAACRACGEAFEPRQFIFRCPNCGSDDTEVIGGDSVILNNIVITEPSVGAIL